MKDSDMITLSKVAEATGVPAPTIRWWGKRGWLADWEARPTITGKAFYTTIQAVETLKSNPPKRGRPVK